MTTKVTEQGKNMRKGVNNKTLLLPFTKNYVSILLVLFCAVVLFPVRINAQFVQQGNKLVGTGAIGNARQGQAVALSSDGNTAIVGAWKDSNGSPGAAWIFIRSGTTWTQQAKLVGTGSIGLTGQGFSVTISADGNTAAFGGYTDNSNKGAVWIFSRSGTVWTQMGTKKIGTGTGGGTSLQGHSVALSGDGNTIIWGAPGDNSNTGAAWVYTRSSGVWTQQGNKLVGTGAVGAAYQGFSVDLSFDGNTAIVTGANDSGFMGATWVFTRSGSTWTQQGSKLVGTGAIMGVGGVRQGYSSSLSDDGNTAVIGGNYDNSGIGAIWVFTRTAGVWTQQGNKLNGTGAIGAAYQGTDVSLSGDGNTFIEGASPDNGGIGAVWFFTRSAGVWTQLGTKLVGTGYVGGAAQGLKVGISADGNTAMEGGPGDNTYIGAAWVFVNGCPGPSLPTLNATSTTNCGTQSTTLSIATGALNSATNWQWYSGTCGGNSEGNGTSITVSPTVTTTYYARGEGGCYGAGACASITITVNSQTTWYLDADNDGHYLGNPVSACTSPGAGYNTTATIAGDCNDNNIAVYQNQNGYVDVDGDGYTVGSLVSICSGASLPSGYSTTSQGTDCNDNNIAIYQSSLLYIDNDGDGYDLGTATVCYGASVPSGYSTTSQGTDCNDNNIAIYQSSLLYIDNDGDGYDLGTATVCYGASVPSGYSATTLGTDCNDSNIAIYQSGLLYVDADGDGYDLGTATVCYGASVPSGYSATTLGIDCNDSNIAIYQSGLLYIDNDGDGYDSGTATVCYGASVPSGYSATTLGTDCNDNNVSIYQSGLLYIDADGDGYDLGTATVCYGATVPTGYSATTLGTDCDDNNISIYQSGLLYIDADGDGYNLGTATVCYGASVPSGYSTTTNGTDCNDNNILIYQSGLLYVDADGDGYDLGTATVCYGASVPSGYSTTTNGTDCNDNNILIYQSGLLYVDADGDGYDLGTATVCYGASVPSGYSATTLGTDCNDNNILIYQSGLLYIDNDGDGYDSGTATVCYGASVPSGYSASTNGTDCNDNNISIYHTINGYIDSDGDGYTVGALVPVCSGAILPLGYSAVSLGNDCDDNNFSSHGAPVGSSSNVVICDGSPANIGLNSTIQGSSFTWTSSVTTGGVIGNSDCTGNCGSTITDLLTNINFVHGVVEYSVIPSFGGCVGSPFTITATVGAAPATPVISGPSVVCGMNNTTFTCATIPEATSYFWTVPSTTGMTILSGQGTTSLHVSLASGSQLGNVTCTASNSCGNSTSALLSVTTKPHAPVSITGPTSVCGQTTATYSTTPAFGATSYQWLIPTGGMVITSGAGTTQITVSINSSFVSGTVKVNAVNLCGNIPGPSLFVTGNVPAPPITIAGLRNICGVTSTSYSVAPVIGATGYIWSLTGAGTIVGSNTGTSVNVLLSGTAAGTISCASTNVCGTGTARTIPLSVSATQPGTITGPANTCGLSTTTYSVAIVPDAVTYNWILPAGMTLVSGGGTSSIVVNIAPQAGNTTIVGTLKVSTTNACGNTSLNRTTQITRCLNGVAINGFNIDKKELIYLYPNPASSLFTIEIKSDFEKEIIVEVYDIIGNKVIEEKHNVIIGQSSIKTSIENYSAGIYFVKLSDTNGTVYYSQRLIKQ